MEWGLKQIRLKSVSVCFPFCPEVTHTCVYSVQWKQFLRFLITYGCLALDRGLFLLRRNPFSFGVGSGINIICTASYGKINIALWEIMKTNIIWKIPRFPLTSNCFLFLDPFFSFCNTLFQVANQIWGGRLLSSVVLWVFYCRSPVDQVVAAGALE